MKNMNPDLFTKLDNPAWWALKGLQQAFAAGAPHIKRYRAGILPFAAFEQGTKDSLDALDAWLEQDEIFYMIGELPSLPPHWELVNELPCIQMIARERMAVTGDSVPISLLTPEDDTELFNLVNKVQPGYYLPGTHRLGNYFGIRQDDRLVAVAGERIRLEGLTEISAICTDPDYTGRQYAQHLIAHICNTCLDQGIAPFLHVLQTNQRAIRLYEYLGFRQRRGITFRKLVKL